jgi:hypothetical protein
VGCLINAYGRRRREDDGYVIRAVSNNNDESSSKTEKGKKQKRYEISYGKAFEDVSGGLIYSCLIIHVH